MGLLRSIAVALRSVLLSSTSSAKSADPRHRLGQQGERIAARVLRRKGLKVLYRNYRAPGGGEIDLVCRDGDTLVFIEVKTRSSETHGAPLEAVNSQKQALIIRGALAWMRLLRHPKIPIRFDIVEVRHIEGKFEVNVVRNAFTLPENIRL